MKYKMFRAAIAVLILAASPLLISGQTNSRGEMPQYLFPGFSKSDVLMKGGKINTTSINFNTVTGKMVFVNNEKYYDLTNPEMVDTVLVNGCKFVPVGKTFYQVLFSGPVILYLQHKGTLMSAGKPVGYGGTSQTASSNYISSIEQSGYQFNLALPADFIVNPSNVYWIRSGDNWFDFTTEKQFLAIFPDKSQKLKAFIKENRIKIDKTESLIKLVEYASSMQ
ncbi:MAG: hypothetical protein MUE74_07200 [Bacteroidales bacterium]|nr:hypothetical protein [Bacteroidales bacterium]